MTNQLIIETKKAIGYTEDQNTCEGCKHSEEIEDPQLDRNWYWICKVNSLCQFKVSKHGRCNLLEKRTTPTK